MNDPSNTLAAELPRLLVFAEVARRSSFSMAAEALGLSRSTVSHHVAALEEALATRLLERSTRAVRTTSEGARLLVAAEAILSEWSSAREELVEGRLTPRGTLVLTAPDVIAERIVAPVIASFVRAHPQCTVDMRVTAQNLDLIREHVDLAIRAGPLPDSEHGARLLTTSEHMIVAAPALLEGCADERDPTALAELPWLGHSKRRRYETIRRGDQLAELPARSSVLVDNAAGLIALAVRGLGCTLLPELLVREELARGELVDVCPGWRAESLTLHAVIPSPRRQTARVRRFVELLISAF